MISVQMEEEEMLQAKTLIGHSLAVVGLVALSVWTFGKNGQPLPKSNCSTSSQPWNSAADSNGWPGRCPHDLFSRRSGPQRYFLRSLHKGRGTILLTHPSELYAGKHHCYRQYPGPADDNWEEWPNPRRLERLGPSEAQGTA